MAQFLSIAGDRIHHLALVSLLSSGADSAANLAWLGVAMLLPSLLLSPFVGPLVDRWRLVSVLVVADALRAVVVAFMPQVAGVPAILSLVFVGFVLNCFFLPARSALPPQLVAEPNLLRANALLTLGGVAATIVGSGFGGKIVDAIGWKNALYLDAATFAISAVMLSTLWGRTRPSPRRRPLRAGRYFVLVSAGLLFLARSPRARRAMLASIGTWVGGGFLFVAGALHAQSAPGRVGSIGALMAVFAGGLALSAGWAMTRRDISSRWALGGGLLGAAIGLAAFAASQTFWLMAGAALWTGLCVGPLLACAETELQRAAGPRRRGRVFAGRDFGSRAAFLVSLGAAGALTPRCGAGLALLVGALALAVIGTVAMTTHRNAADRGSAVA
ncbi:MAG TPA: MFS transporter [Candidatus Eisenbacteria bacterium]|nr:MFS transporter [Candidatus Eisenbacteria bacterium]